MTLVLGTRGSALALWQARFVQNRLAQLGYSVRLETFTTTGDRILDVPLSKIGDKALFTKELDLALLEGRIHLAVHSLKDLPTRLPEGIKIAAVTERAEPWDAFVAAPHFKGALADLPHGASVATSSLRRQAQLKAWRPDLRIESIRGNVDTRIAKLDAGNWHGMILAAAGLVRLGLEDRIAERVKPEIMLPAVGQGALGIVCNQAEESVCQILDQALNHAETAAAVAAERAFLRRLEGGCQVPIGAIGRLAGRGKLVLEGCVADLSGRRVFRASISGDPDVGRQLGIHLAEHLLSLGAGEVLRSIREHVGE